MTHTTDSGIIHEPGGILTADGESAPSRKPEFSPEVLAALPRPTGYRMLIGLPKVEETYEGSNIVKSQDTMATEKVSTVVGTVLMMGPDCYTDEARFPNGAYCEEGDHVVFPAFSGIRIGVFGREFRIINDDTVSAVVDNPSGITRWY